MTVWAIFTLSLTRKGLVVLNATLSTPGTFNGVGHAGGGRGYIKLFTGGKKTLPATLKAPLYAAENSHPPSL
jgi:hypothetical protein